MSADLPAGQPVEIEFIRPDKPHQRGVLPRPLADEPGAGQGFWFHEVRVPRELGFDQPFRIEIIEKWINLATVAEIRHLPAGALDDEIDRLRQLHEQVRHRLDRP